MASPVRCVPRTSTVPCCVPIASMGQPTADAQRLQPPPQAQVALAECEQARALRPVKYSVLLIQVADVQSHTQQECRCPWEGGTRV